MCFSCFTMVIIINYNRIIGTNALISECDEFHIIQYLVPTTLDVDVRLKIVASNSHFFAKFIAVF